MDQEYDTYAYFWVSDFDCEPEVISDILGLKPYRTFKKGDLISDKTKTDGSIALGSTSALFHATSLVRMRTSLI